jgi:acyl carrier protein
MKKEEVRTVVLDTIRHIAPDADVARLPPAAALREELDLDSFDFLQLIVGLHERLGVAIPERDYARLVSLDDLTGYLQERLP